MVEELSRMFGARLFGHDVCARGRSSCNQFSSHQAVEDEVEDGQVQGGYQEVEGQVQRVLFDDGDLSSADIPESERVVRNPLTAHLLWRSRQSFLHFEYDNFCRLSSLQFVVSPGVADLVSTLKSVEGARNVILETVKRGDYDNCCFEVLRSIWRTRSSEDSNLTSSTCHQSVQHEFNGG